MFQQFCPQILRAEYVRNVWNSYYSWMTSGGVRRSWSWSTAGPSKERWSSMATLQGSTMLWEHGVSSEILLMSYPSININDLFFIFALCRRHVKVPGWEDNPTEQVLTLIITTFCLFRNTCSHYNPHVWTLICLLCSGCRYYESSWLTPKCLAAPRCLFPGWKTRLTRYWMASSLPPFTRWQGN